MGRKSALTSKQWKDIETRFYAGESASALAREYGITEAAIRKRFGANRTKAQNLANQLVAVETEINKCDLGTKSLVRTYADQQHIMRSLRDSVAINGLTSAKQLSDIVTARIKSMPAEELMDGENLKQLMAVGLVINTHSKMGMEALAIDAKTPKESEEKPTIHIIGGINLEPKPYDYPLPNKSDDGLDA